MVWRDPATGQVQWATPVGPNTYRIPAVAPVAAPHAESAVELFQAAPQTPLLFVLELPLTGAALKAIEAALLPYALWRWNEATYATSQFWSGNGHAGNQLGTRCGAMVTTRSGCSTASSIGGASCFGSGIRGPLDPGTVGTLGQRYRGQVFAFD